MPAPPPTGDEIDDDTSVDSLIRALAKLPSAPRSRDELAQALHQTHFQRFTEVTRGRYELKSLLGVGGMGIVYDARNPRTQRAVAIKFLRLRTDEPVHVQRERALRFVREASAAGRIRHPNVVDIYDVEADVATPYLVMERLEGESLRQRISRGPPLSPVEAVGILTEAMRGVVEAHQHGVIHRDLKPDNIFLAKSRARDARVVKVLDFGVSRLLASDGTARPSALTGAGHLLGTPAYMPVEQLRGDPDCDARVDVYALGVTLYESICRRRPVAAAKDGSVALVAWGEVVPLATRCPDVDGELSAIVMRAMSSERSERYADASSFLLALEDWLSQARRVAAPPSPSVVPASSRGAARFLALGVSSLVLALALATWLSEEPAHSLGTSGQGARPVQVAESAAPRRPAEHAPLIRQSLTQQLAPPPLTQREGVQRDELRKAAGSHAESAGDSAGLEQEAAAAAARSAAGERGERSPATQVSKRKGRARATKGRFTEPRDIQPPSPAADSSRAFELRSTEF